MAFDGNERTRQLLPRIAAQTNAEAGVKLTLPLRIGVVLDAVEERLHWFGKLKPLLSHFSASAR